MLYHPERHVAALRRLSDGLGEAHCRQAHVPWLPRMWLSTVRSLRRLVMRLTSSMTRVFYNSRAADARQGKFEGGAGAPPSWSEGKVSCYCLLTASR